MYDYDLFLALVRAGLWHTELEDKYLKQDFDWFNSVIKPGYNQTVLGLVAEASLRCLFVDCECTEKNVAKQIITQVKDASQHHEKVLINVNNLLGQKGIEPILLKGQGLASNYPDPSLRQCGDIDIYVDEKDYSIAHDILSSNREIGKKNKESDKHYAVVIDGIEIELHRFTERMCNPFVNKKFQSWTKESLECNYDCLLINNHSIKIPSVDYNIIYTFCHLWNHFEIAGIGLRQLCDFASAIHKNFNKYDISLLEKKLKEFHLLKAWQLIGGVVVKYLGLPANEYPLFREISDKKINGVLKLIIENGNFGQDTRNKFLAKSYSKSIVIRPFYPVIYYTRHLFQIFPYTGYNILWRVLKKIGISRCAELSL